MLHQGIIDPDETKFTPETEYNRLKNLFKLGDDHLKKILEIYFDNVLKRYIRKHKCTRCLGLRHVGCNDKGELMPCITCLNIYQCRLTWYKYCDGHDDLKFYADSGRKQGYLKPDLKLIEPPPEKPPENQ